MIARITHALALMTAMAAAAGAQRGVIAGQVIVRASSVSVGYSVISANPGAREQFTGSDGRFVLRDLPVGRVTLSVKRIGYVPLDTTVVVSATDTLHLKLEMSLVVIRLPAVASMAKACAHPGSVDGQVDLALAALLEQMKENADRHRLLARTYPFELDIERRISKPEPALETRFIAYDTVVRMSERDWHYAPGKLLGTREYAPGVFGGKWLTVTMPELDDFADPRFLDAHCFDYGGYDVLDRDTLLRIEFSPAAHLRDPDVGGTIFLDPKTYQLRTVMISLVNLTKQLQKQIGGQAIRADFKEIIPGVPVIDRISSMVYPRDDPKSPPQEPSMETQRTLAARFLKGRP